MIKICSLDFLNNDFFEADVKTAEGRVIVSSGEKVTPGLILKLYFKDIYVDQPLDEKIGSMISKSSDETRAADIANLNVANIVNDITSISNEVTVTESEITETETAETKVEPEEPLPEPATTETEQKEQLAEPVTTAPEIKESLPEITVIEPLPEVAATQTMSEDKESKPKKEPHLVVQSPAEAGTKEDKTKSGPTPAAPSMETEEEENIEADSSEKGPRFAEEGEFVNKKEREKHIYALDSGETSAEIEEKVDEDPENKQLKFDEEQAKRVVQNSVKLGKLLNYSAKELKELEIVAHNCNIGIDNFKQKDTKRKDFSQLKVLASYKKLVDDELIPKELADIVKYCASSYESETFQLNTKIPYHHVVAITNYYEDSLLQNRSKEEVLLQMLQYGGNKFNIFVLHKFIKLMREMNE